MPRPLREIEAEALELSDAERDALAQSLFASLDQPQSEEVRQAWVSDVRSRHEDIEQGRVELIPGDLVVARLRAKVR